MLQIIAQELKNKHGGKVAVCAPTGVAAVLIGGTTLHSLAGCGVPRRWDDYAKMWADFTKKKWRKLQALIVDEVLVCACVRAFCVCVCVCERGLPHVCECVFFFIQKHTRTCPSAMPNARQVMNVEKALRQDTYIHTYMHTYIRM